MSYSINKKGEIVFSQWERGIAASPHKGIGNIQNANISTENGEVMCSMGRTQQSQVISSGTFTQFDGSTLTASLVTGGRLKPGTWVTINTSTNLNAGTNYYIADGDFGNNSRYNLKATFTNTNDYISTFGSGTATYTTMTQTGGTIPTGTLGLAVATATELYSDASGISQSRQYILTEDGLVWAHDSNTGNFPNLVNPPVWFLPNTTLHNSVRKASGLAVLNGWLFMFQGNAITAKSTVQLANDFSTFIVAASGQKGGVTASLNPHFAFVGHQGYLLYTDGSFLGKIFPDITVNTSYVGGVNIQSFCSYTASGDTGTITDILSGSIPTVNNTLGTRTPVVFFASSDGASSAIPSALTADTVYWVEMTSLSTFTFKVYAAASGGSAIADLTTGAAGTQYFNTFYPVSLGGSVWGGVTNQVFTPQRLNLPAFEISQSIGELGSTILVGCKGNVVYQWNQISVTPGDFVNVPENNVVNILTVNNMGFLFAGSKGNIYITNGSSASAVISVPDYCAGIAGTQASYFEPYFTWGDAIYLRGRVYFSILDQTSTKTGNCGGVWSFTPTQNMFFGNDQGLALRLENQNSYGTYNGVATVLIDSQVQGAISPQYWSAWYSTISSPVYGIDFTSTTPVGTTVVETDLVPTGYLLGEQKKTFQNIEYKLASPLANGESISIAYRKNSTESYTDLGTAVVETSTDLSGVFTASFENTRWLQLRITLTPLASASTSFCRLTEIIAR